MKQCGTCKEFKDESFFNKKGKFLQSYCKECNKKQLKKHYQENKEYYRLKSLRNKQIIIDMTRDAKNIPCTDCKQSYPYYVMDFDHLGDKSFTIATAWVRHGRLAIKNELKKCEPVCANCHRIRTHQRKTLMPSGVIGNTTDFESVESTFEP